MICAIIIASHMGGSIADFTATARWAEQSGCQVRIDGACASACVVLSGVGCVTPSARLGFHAPTGTDHPDHWAQHMAEHMPPAMGRWYMSGPAQARDVVWINAASAVQLGARPC